MKIKSQIARELLRKRDFFNGSVENAECGVRKMRGVENAECRKCGVWKMRGVENEYKISIFHFNMKLTNIRIPLYSH